VIKSRRQSDIGALLRQDGLTEEELLDIHLLHLQMDGLGMGPLEPQAKVRQPYDSLFLKLKYSQEF
jgi:hypothetical protein